MKKLYLLAAIMLLSIKSSLALEPYNPPEFNPEEWTYLGVGEYTPGVFDWLGNEYPYELPAKMWENKETPNVYWVEVDGSAMEPFEPEFFEGDTWFEAPHPFIVYANDAEKVYTSPIWAIHPAIFCVYHQVPDIMGVLGSAENYGTKDGDYITFPASCYKMLTVPTGSPTTNTRGTFSVTLPDPAGVEAIESNETAPSEYFNIQGMKVTSPEHGNIYIVKNGKNSKKVVF